MRRLVAVVTFAVSILAGVAGQPAQAAPPMQFAVWQEGPADACTDKCRVWVQAYGAIRPDTAQIFESFARHNDIRGMTIAFESEGGSVLGALALGRSIRRLEMTTTVGRAIPLVPEEASDPRAKLSPRADCESMCAFVLLAGVKRFVPAEARVRVHQIWLGDRRDDATAASYSAEDLVLVQRDIGRLAQYTAEMGGAIDLLTVALRIPPWEPMRVLSRDELRRMNLDMAQDNTMPAVANPPVAALSPAATTGGRMAPLGEGGWALVEQGGRYSLARRHPLTIEGDEIGSFDISFSCGETAEDYALIYAERRVSADPVKEVAISVRGNAMPLKIISSDPRQQRAERSAIANATVPASLLKALAEPGSRSLTVSTGGAASPTVIRLGNTGIAQNFPRLAEACIKQGRVRREHASLVK